MGIGRWLENNLNGHISCGRRLVFFGFNAMHVAAEFWTGSRWLVAHPPMLCFGRYWPGYVYVSRNATPGRADWIVGMRERRENDGVPSLLGYLAGKRNPKAGR